MSNIYIPPNSITLDKVSIPQFRIGIQGPAGEGKTYAALTFPNTVVANFNRGLGAHIGRADVIEIPFWQDSFVDAIVRRTPNGPANRRDAIKKWVDTEGKKLTSEQTLVIDAGTDIDESFHQQEALEPVLTDKGSIDKFAVWRHKIDYFGELHTSIKGLQCNVIWISHETVDRDSKGELNGKIRPLLAGQFGDKIMSNYTDWLIQMAGDKKPIDKVTPEILEAWGFKTKEEYKAMQDSFPRGTIYFWETESTDIQSAKVSSLVNFPRFIPANYSSFIKYLRTTKKV